MCGSCPDATPIPPAGRSRAASSFGAFQIHCANLGTTPPTHLQSFKEIYEGAYVYV